MTNLQRKEINQYIANIGERFSGLREFLIVSLNVKIDSFDKIPKEQQDELKFLLDKAKKTQQDIRRCCDEITMIESKAIKRAVDIEIKHISTHKEARPLFLIVHELFSKCLQLSYLGLHTNVLLNDMVNILRSVDGQEDSTKTILAEMKTNGAKLDQLSAQMAADHNQLSAQMTAEHNQQAKKSTEEIRGYKKSKERQKIPYPAAAKILLIAEGVKKPTQKQIKSTGHRMRGWDNYIDRNVVKNKHKPPEHYNGRECTTAEFAITCKDILKEKGYRKNLSNPANYDENMKTDGNSIFDI